MSTKNPIQSLDWQPEELQNMMDRLKEGKTNKCIRKYTKGTYIYIFVYVRTYLSLSYKQGI